MEFGYEEEKEGQLAQLPADIFFPKRKMKQIYWGQQKKGEQGDR